MIKDMAAPEVVMERVKGKKAIVTGAARGLGKEIALTLAGEGADVAIWDIAVDAAERTAAEIRELGRESLAMQVDVTSSTDVNAAVSDVLKKFDFIDILVNNAGIVSAAPTILDLTDEQWAKEISVNLTGAFYCTRAVLKKMIKRCSGKIVNIGSLAGELGRPITSAGYSSSKAGVIGFTMSVAQSVAKYGINVNAVCPGLILTEIHNDFSEEQLLTLQADIPFNRDGKKGAHGIPQDVASAVLFLASSESDYITGTRIRVNGGSLMG
ncbi:MAG: SDR family NAD(P)-dependent oxidoreductase [Planctomycetota bacterium]|jgi:3-oxoacyl-[acyl-carrier protein] reductase